MLRKCYPNTPESSLCYLLCLVFPQFTVWYFQFPLHIDTLYFFSLDQSTPTAHTDLGTTNESLQALLWLGVWGFFAVVRVFKPSQHYKTKSHFVSLFTVICFSPDFWQHTPLSESRACIYPFTHSNSTFLVLYL